MIDVALYIASYLVTMSIGAVLGWSMLAYRIERSGFVAEEKRDAERDRERMAAS